MSAQIIGESKPTARKQHRCDLCSRFIEVGERYDRARIVGDDGPYVWKNCAHCAALVRLTTAVEEARYDDEGWGPDTVAEWEPGRFWEARLLVQWRRRWLRRDGALYPVPTALGDPA